jgi:iron complex transport system substrate-binding protein
VGPRRIVCLTEEPTELLYLLGEEERIVGISVYAKRPERAAKEKPKVTSFITGSVEKIAALKPDLIIGFSDIQANLARDLISAGLPVLITNQRSIDEILQTMQMLGCLVGAAEKTRQLIAEWKQALDHYERQGRRLAEQVGTPTVLFMEWEDPFITGIGWVSELIELLGGRDVFASLKQKTLAKDRIVTLDQVHATEAGVLIGSWCGKPLNRQWIQDHLSRLPAVKAGRVHEIESEIILQPGPALFIDGAPAMLEAMYFPHYRKSG